MELHKAKLLQVKLLSRPSKFMYFRLANASQVYFLWFDITWRRGWLPKAIYMQGWNACWRELYYSGSINIKNKLVNDYAPSFTEGDGKIKA